MDIPLLSKLRRENMKLFQKTQPTWPFYLLLQLPLPTPLPSFIFSTALHVLR